jgi:hypothetical protein
VFFGFIFGSMGKPLTFFLSETARPQIGLWQKIKVNRNYLVVFFTAATPGDDSNFAKTCYPIGLKSDGGGKGSVLVDNGTERRISHQPFQKHPIIYFVFLIS